MKNVLLNIILTWHAPPFRIQPWKWNGNSKSIPTLRALPNKVFGSNYMVGHLPQEEIYFSSVYFFQILGQTDLVVRVCCISYPHFRMPLPLLTLSPFNSLLRLDVEAWKKGRPSNHFTSADNYYLISLKQWHNFSECDHLFLDIFLLDNIFFLQVILMQQYFFPKSILSTKRTH